MIIGFDTNKKFIAWAIVDIADVYERFVNHGIVKDDKYYLNVLSNLILSSGLICCEEIQFYSDVKINASSIRAIERIGHIQAICMWHKKEYNGSTRPEVLKSLFGSSRVKKGHSKKLLSVRTGQDLKKISQHCCDAAMVAIHTFYKKRHEAYTNRSEVI